ncbi:MAG: carboxypeptidase regulatory-like domain-containing protein [Armatimonadota bacterium]
MHWHACAPSIRGFRTLFFLLVVFLLAPAAAHAVTWTKVDGQSPPATFSIHDDIVLTLDCAFEGGLVRMKFALDLNKDGKYQEGEPVDTSADLVDQGQDMDPTPKVIKVPFHVNPSTPPGQYVAHFEDEDGSVLEATAFVLPKKYPQSISGTALDESGGPVPWTLVWVRTTDKNEEVASNWADDQGNFTVEVPAGTYRVYTQSLEAQVSVPKLVTVRPGEKVTGVRLVVRRGVLVGGKVTDASDQPVPYALVRAQGKNQTWYTQTFIDGTYSFALQPGQYLIALLAFPDPQTTEVSVEDSPLRNVDLYVPEWGRMEGTVKPLPAATEPAFLVKITNAAGASFTVEADTATGFYALAAAPGRYEVVVSTGAGRVDPQSRTAALEAGRTVSGLDFTVQRGIPGDLTGDGKVTVPDATLALQIAVGKAQPTSSQLSAGDLNGNGKIDIADVTRILRKAVGLE